MSHFIPAMIGGLPTKIPDIPVGAVFIALFALLAGSHMFLFITNKQRGHLFVFNAMLFGFGMSRIAANALRIGWAVQRTNIGLAISSTILLYAGILLVYIMNNILVWRMLRSRLPAFGWHRVARLLYKIQLWLCLPIIIILIITVTIARTEPTAYRAQVQEKVARFAQTWFFVIAAQPLFLISIAHFWPTAADKDEFGSGSHNVRAVVLYTTTLLATIEAAFRLATTWQPARPMSNAAWYDGKAAFYCFNFTIDVLILVVFLVARIDRRFHIPNKADGPGSYSAAREKAAASGPITEEDKGGNSV